MIRANFIIFLLLACLPLRSQVQQFFVADSLSFISSPLGLDSLFYWFAADLGVTDSLGGAIANNEGVGTWNDQSGNGRHLYSLIDARRRPTYKTTGGPGGRPTLVFKDDSTSMITTDSAYWNSDNFSMFYVAKANSTSDYSRILARRRNDALTFLNWIFQLGEQALSGRQDDVYMYVYNDAGTENFYRSADIVDTNFRLYYAEQTGGAPTQAIYRDAALQALSGTATVIRNGRADLWVGALTAQQADFTVSEMVIFSKLLSTAEREAMERYLNKKYDLY